MTSNLEGLFEPPEQPLEQNKVGLVIAAHPDDADFGAAGTVRLWVNEGWTFYYLVCTNGAKGSDDPSITPQQLAETRRREQRDAAKVVGASDVFFLDYEDGELTPNRQFLGDVVRVIRQLRPSTVFTHDPESVIINDAFINHSDHRATGLTAIDAIYPAARDRHNFPEQIAEGLEPHKVSAIYIWTTERDNHKVDITSVIDDKIRAMAAHASQFEDEFLQRMRDIWKSTDGRYYESFRRVIMAI